MAWLSGWTKRVKLTIDNTDIDAVLSNFPILLALGVSIGRNADDVSFVFDELQSDANRKKIAVTTSDGTTECYVEIEKWDDANEKAWLWVKVPSIASGADTDLYLYYNIAHADNGAYVGDPSDAVVHNVWDSNFKFVSHMGDDPNTSSIRDSTVNANDGTKSAANEPIETDGNIAKAQDFDGENDNIALPSALGVLIGDFDISVWVRIPNTGNYETILCKGDTSHTATDLPRLWLFRINIDRTITFGWRLTTGGGFFSVTSSTALTANTLYLITVKRTGSVIKIFYNTTEDFTDGVGSDFGDFTADFQMGRLWGGVGGWLHYWSEILEEIRISNTARTLAWTKASYESARDDLLDWGSEEEGVVDIPPLMHKDLIDPYSGGAWLWLVEIVIPGQTTQRIARDTADVVYGGVSFPKGNFEPPRQSLSGDGSVPTVVLRIAQDPDHILENIINASKGGTNGTVKIIRTCEKFLDVSVAELEADFDILTAGSNTEWVIFTLGMPSPLIQRIPLWLYSSKICPYATPSLFKGVRCQYTGADPTCTGLLEDCFTKGNIVHWGAEVGLDPSAVRV